MNLAFTYHNNNSPKKDKIDRILDNIKREAKLKEDIQKNQLIMSQKSIIDEFQNIETQKEIITKKTRNFGLMKELMFSPKQQCGACSRK